MTDYAAIRSDSLLRYLRRHLEGEIRFDETSRRLYATDASLYQILPLGVIVPKHAEDLANAIRIAADLDVPITPRGGGTSLTGQSIGPGLVLDCSKHLNAILEIDAALRTARIQPGVVLDDLNRALLPHNLMFGPDVATANRATLGGMIGNNSAGARSVVYGQTMRHIRRLDAILADGSRTTFEANSPRDRQRKLELTTLEGAAYREADRVRREHAGQIERRYPKILRRVSGYNLADLTGESLIPLLAGSEGTLAMLAEVELNLVPRPAHRGLLVPHFDSLPAALDAVQACLSLQPSAVELMDALLIELAREQRSLKTAMAAIRGHPVALLMVEFMSDSPAEIDDKLAKLSAKLKGANGLTAAVTASDPSLRDPLWALRSGAVPLLYGLPGDRKPVTFCEDAAVTPEKMPEFARRFREIFRKHGTDGSFYGHASVGCLHIRPVLNLHDRADVARMRAIMTEVTDLVLEFHGSLSGEHGDGLVRSEWNRKMFGDELYEAFRRIKRAFDPQNTLNPGKIVDAQAMEENLRVEPGRPLPSAATVFDYSPGGFFRSIEVCNGAGVCRKTQGGAMCPSYRATKDEQDSTRGRANALRLAMLGDDRGVSQPPASLRDRWLKPVMDLCLSCKACKSECPSNVDMAKLKAEFDRAYYTRRPRPISHRIARKIDKLSTWACYVAGPLNWLGRRKLMRSMLESLTGLDRRRSLPRWHRHHFRDWFARRPRPANATRRVILLDDCFMTYQEPQLGRAAVELLERSGVRVDLAGFCCGRALISKGYLDEARDVATAGLRKLAKSQAAGTPILGLEPSCLLTLADEWPELVPGPAAQAVADNVFLIEEWFAEEVHAGRLPFAPRPSSERVLFHGHCHQKALVGTSGSVNALKLLGLEVDVLDAGCCGMAGLFGFDHFDISVKIANLQLIPALAASDAPVVATGTSCRHQIRDLTGRAARHPIEWLAEAAADRPGR